jgi:hypothetical protein
MELYPFIQLFTNMVQLQIWHGYVFPDEIIENPDERDVDKHEERKTQNQVDESLEFQKMFEDQHL